jgi:hypothetical protein
MITFFLSISMALALSIPTHVALCKSVLPSSEDFHPGALKLAGCDDCVEE